MKTLKLFAGFVFAVIFIALIVMKIEKPNAKEEKRAYPFKDSKRI